MTENKPREVTPKIDIEEYQELVTQCITADSPPSDGKASPPSPTAPTVSSGKKDAPLVAPPSLVTEAEVRFPLRLIISLILSEFALLISLWVVGAQTPTLLSEEEMRRELNKRFSTQLNRITSAEALIRAAQGSFNPDSESFMKTLFDYNALLRDPDESDESQNEFLLEHFVGEQSALRYEEPLPSQE